MIKTKERELSIILPCKDEELAIQQCIDEINRVICRTNIDAEVIIVDNNSRDNSKEIVLQNISKYAWLSLIEEVRDGYGSAYLSGFNRSSGKYIYMADADGTYDFNDIPKFIDEIKKGADLVVGNRFSKKIGKGVMPILHRYIGNPILSYITRTLFKVKLNDIHCGERMIRRDALSKIVLYTRGMEFASEMIIKSARADLVISELPIVYRKRIGKSKLRSLNDGWRHLRFLLLYSPIHLFLLPGVAIFFVGLLSLIALYLREIKILGIKFYFHPMFISSLFMILGYELILFSGFAKVYAVTHLGDQDKLIVKLFRYLTLEKALFFGSTIIISGAIIFAYIFYKWISTGLGSLDETKNAIFALTMIIIGTQTFFSAFMLSILGIKER